MDQGVRARISFVPDASRDSEMGRYKLVLLYKTFWKYILCLMPMKEARKFSVYVSNSNRKMLKTSALKRS